MGLARALLLRGGHDGGEVVDSSTRSLRDRIWKEWPDTEGLVVW